MVLSKENEAWARKAVEDIVKQVGNGRDFDPFGYGESGPDESPPMYVLDDVIQRLELKGIRASRRLWHIWLTPPDQTD